jgi:hypothetical protein
VPLTAQIDVNLPEDPAIVAAGPDAEHLFIRSILLAKRIMTDGLLHHRQALRCAQDLSAVVYGEVSAQQLCDRLVEHGLWTLEGDQYRIRAWLTWNKPAEEIKEAHERDKARKRAWAEERKARDHATESRRVADASTRRRATRSEGEGEGEGEGERGGTGGKDNILKRTQTRGTRIPDPFPVTDEMISWAQTETPNIDWAAETRKFKDHWLAQPGQRGVKLNWNAVWRNWLRKAQEGNYR